MCRPVGCQVHQALTGDPHRALRTHSSGQGLGTLLISTAGQLLQSSHIGIGTAPGYQSAVRTLVACSQLQEPLQCLPTQLALTCREAWVHPLQSARTPCIVRSGPQIWYHNLAQRQVLLRTGMQLVGRTARARALPLRLLLKGTGAQCRACQSRRVERRARPMPRMPQHRSADSSSKQAQARLLLGDSRQDNYARHGYQSLPVQEVRAASGANGLVRDEHESTGMSVDEGRAGSAGTLSPRHSISSLRPYANDASLQVCALDPSHLLVAPAGGTGI